MVKTHPAAGGFVAAFRAADTHGLSRHDRGGGIALVHAVGVHHPGHDLRVRVDVGRRNVAVRTDQWLDFHGVAPGQLLKLLWR